MINNKNALLCQTGNPEKSDGSKSQPIASRQRCRSTTLSRAAEKWENSRGSSTNKSCYTRCSASAHFSWRGTYKYVEIKAGSCCMKRKRSRVSSAPLYLAGRLCRRPPQLAGNTQKVGDLFTPHCWLLLQVSCRIRHFCSIHRMLFSL